MHLLRIILADQICWRFTNELQGWVEVNTHSREDSWYEDYSWLNQYTHVPSFSLMFAFRSAFLLLHVYFGNLSKYYEAWTTGWDPQYMQIFELRKFCCLYVHQVNDASSKEFRYMQKAFINKLKEKQKSI